MKIETKYEIGQKLFWIDKYDNIYRLHFSHIKSINIGGKIWEKYEIGNTTRAERELWLDFDEAKEVCIKKQQENNEGLLEEVKNYTEERTKRNN